jgi:hypothetical protein
LKVQRFLKSKTIETPEDISLQLQMFAYMVAKHYGISLKEVYEMDEMLFRQSVAWALAVDEVQQKEMEKQEMIQRSGSNEVVSFDYSFLEREDF